MRTTIRLDDAFLARARARATSTGRTLSAVIEDALRRTLAEEPVERPVPVLLPTFGDRLQPGLDLDQSAALLDLMEDGRSAGRAEP